MLRFRYCEVAGSCGVGQPTLRMKSRQVASVITIPGNKKFVRPKNAHAPRVAYDLKKLRAKNLLTKLGNSHRYSIPSEAICIIGALVILRDKVLRPILAGVGKRNTGRKPKNWSLIDEHYETIRQDMFTLFEDLRIAA